MVGRLQIIDENTIKLKGITLSLSDIEKVKKHPWVASIGNAVGFITLASGILVTGAGLSGQNSSDEPFVIGIGLSIGALYASTQPINLFDKGYDVNKKWRFEIAISLPEMQNSSNKKMELD